MLCYVIFVLYHHSMHYYHYYHYNIVDTYILYFVASRWLRSVQLVGLGWELGLDILFVDCN